MHYDFSVAPCFERMTLLNQLVVQLTEVVNLAVKYYPNTLIFVCQRLMPAGKVNDRKPPMARPTGPEQ